VLLLLAEPVGGDYNFLLVDVGVCLECEVLFKLCVLDPGELLIRALERLLVEAGRL